MINLRMTLENYLMLKEIQRKLPRKESTTLLQIMVSELKLILPKKVLGDVSMAIKDPTSYFLMILKRAKPKTRKLIQSKLRNILTSSKLVWMPERRSFI